MPLIVTGPPDEQGYIPGMKKVYPILGPSLFQRYPRRREWSGWYGYDANGIFDPTFDLEATKKKNAEERKAKEEWWAEEWRAREATQAATATTADRGRTVVLPFFVIDFFSKHFHMQLIAFLVLVNA